MSEKSAPRRPFSPRPKANTMLSAEAFGLVTRQVSVKCGASLACFVPVVFAKDEGMGGGGWEVGVERGEYKKKEEKKVKK